MELPEFPHVLSSQRTQGSVYMRFEDVSQDGALKVLGMPAAVGLVCLGKLWFKTQTSRETQPHGIVPILTRLAMQSTFGPMSVRLPVEADGAYQLAHVREIGGEVSRVLLNAHVELYAPKGVTHGPQPVGAGQRIHVGRAFAEHVFTRPWARSEERKVRALPTADGPLVPGPNTPFRDPLSTLSPATQLRWVDADYVEDVAPVAFGLTHTDSNQHVNSLVYPQVFEDAALRRWMDLGQDTSSLLVDFIDVAFRKPCFSGQRHYVHVRAFEHHGQLGVVAFLGPKGCAPERAHCMCALTFRSGPVKQP
jgi:hypothetical protein